MLAFRKIEPSSHRTRAALIEAGIELFAEQGLDAPLSSICDHAGFTRGAFYVHFKDREELLVAIIEKLVDDYLENVLPPADDPRDFANAIDAFIGGLSQNRSLLGERGKLSFNQLLEACTRSRSARRRIEALVARVVDRLARSLKLCAAQGMFRDDVDHRMIAHILIVLAFGMKAGIEVGMDVPIEGFANAMLVLFAPPSSLKQPPRSVPLG